MLKTNEIYLDSLKFMMDISKKVIKKNLEPNTIDADLKEIFKKYEDNL